MSRARLGLLIALLGLVALPVCAWPEPTPEELERNSKALDKLSQHPEQLARLRRDWQAFLALSGERREQIVKLDEELHELPFASQTRLQNVMERYADWLERLDDKDRQRIKDAPDKKARLAVIRELREQEWIRYQPKTLRDTLAKLARDERSALIHKLRLEERQRQLEWQLAKNFWEELVLKPKKNLPTRLADYNKAVQDFVAEYLQPKLSQEEIARLDKAQGAWPLFPQTLVEIADKHPPALPELAGPTHLKDLPGDVQKVFKKGTLPKSVKAAEGKWPEFAVAIAEWVRNSKSNVVLLHELWPSNFKGLSPPMQIFVDEVLRPRLSDKETLRLLHAEGWPKYPQTIQELADHHKLRPPWYVLPAPTGQEKWELYRPHRLSALEGPADLPRQRLLHFALFELDPKERAALNLSASDSSSWQRLVQAMSNTRVSPEKLPRAIPARAAMMGRS